MFIAGHNGTRKLPAIIEISMKVGTNGSTPMVTAYVISGGSKIATHAGEIGHSVCSKYKTTPISRNDTRTGMSIMPEFRNNVAIKSAAPVD